MNISLAGKSALITGSVSGIGFGIAKALAKAGANVMIHGYGSEEEIETALQKLKGYGTKVQYAYANLLKADESQLLVRTALRALGGVDILVNNAGIAQQELVEEISDTTWRDVVSVNLSAPFFTTKTALPHMQKQRWGRIVNIASVYGLVGSPSRAALVASKHGLVGLTKTTALENSQVGVTANAICPGFVLTELNQKRISEIANEYGINEEEARMRLTSGQMPSKKYSNVEDIGELVLFLASKYGDNITGASYTVDGGWTSQ